MKAFVEPLTFAILFDHKHLWIFGIPTLRLGMTHICLGKPHISTRPGVLHVSAVEKEKKIINPVPGLPKRCMDLPVCWFSVCSPFLVAQVLISKVSLIFSWPCCYVKWCRKQSMVVTCSYDLLSIAVHLEQKVKASPDYLFYTTLISSFTSD